VLVNKQSARICSQVAGPRFDSDYDSEEVSHSSVSLVPELKSGRRGVRRASWTSLEDRILRENYYMGINTCAALLPKRTRCAIQMRASLMGLYVSPLYSRRNPRTEGLRKRPVSRNAGRRRETQSLYHRSEFGYLPSRAHLPAYERLAALLTAQMEAQSKRWGFPVGHMEGRIKGQRIGVITKDKDSDAT
jgi:hypothetical protein